MMSMAHIITKGHSEYHQSVMLHEAVFIFVSLTAISYPAEVRTVCRQRGPGGFPWFRPDTMWKSMIHSPDDCKEEGSFSCSGLND